MGHFWEDFLDGIARFFKRLWRLIWVFFNLVIWLGAATGLLNWTFFMEDKGFLTLVPKLIISIVVMIVLISLTIHFYKPMPLSKREKRELAEDAEFERKKREKMIEDRTPVDNSDDFKQIYMEKFKSTPKIPKYDDPSQAIYDEEEEIEGKVRYHINPYTCSPVVCRAKDGECPYKGRTAHFTNYEEAQAKSDELRVKQFEHTQDLEHIARNREWDSLRTYDYLENMSGQEAMDEIISTQDPALLRSVLNGEVLMDKSDIFSTAALSNPEIPNIYRDSIIKAPNLYSKEALLSLSENPRLTNEEIIGLVYGYPNDSRFVEKILQNPKIDSNFIAKILDDFEQDPSSHPRIFAGLMRNPNCPKDYYDRWLHTPDLFKIFSSSY